MQGFPSFKISNFESAQDFRKKITGKMTYEAPEVLLAREGGKDVIASLAIDSFAMGCMIIDIFSDFSFYHREQIIIPWLRSIVRLFYL